MCRFKAGIILLDSETHWTERRAIQAPGRLQKVFNVIWLHSYNARTGTKAQNARYSPFLSNGTLVFILVHDQNETWFMTRMEPWFSFWFSYLSVVRCSHETKLRSKPLMQKVT